MSRRPTASFFDQDHSAKSRAPYWKRNPNSLQQRDFPTHISRTNPAAGSTVPISTESKSKLGAFTFSKPCTPSKTDRKSKHTFREGDSDDDTLALQDPVANSNIPCLALDPVKECPKTPAPRLPLSDLIGIGDEGMFPQATPQTKASPEDRIMWQLSPRGTPDVASQTTPAPNKAKRGKKRSNSPLMSSPNVDSPVGRKRKEAFNQQLGVAKTPLADPAMQLWSKYSTTGSSNGTNAQGANPAIRLFGTEASPRRGANQSPLGLRRAYSCGPDWPLARLKRRRMISSEDASELDESMEVLAENEEEIGYHGHGPSRLSRVSRLVDKVKETLEKPSSMPNIPSSSPIPHSHDHPLDVTSSPTRRGGKGYEIHPEGIESGDGVNGEKQFSSSDSEDFGDFDDGDIDMIMLGRAEELAGDSLVVHQNNGSFTEALVLEPELPLNGEQQKLVPGGGEEGDDEFGDCGDEFYTADVENLISKYEATQTALASDSHSTSPALSRHHTNLQPVSYKTATDIAASQVLDEFGDIDFDEWNEEELQLSNGLI